jgi:hypothetical protein
MHEGKVRTWDYNRAERASERRRGIRLTDARRMAVYLAKYGIAGRKDHQHHIPVLCIREITEGTSPVRRKLYRVEEVAEVLQRWSTRRVRTST